MDIYRGKIFLLYIVENKTAVEVRAVLKEEHEINVSSKVFSTQLGKWGYTKNLKRSEVLEVTQELARREVIGEEFAFTLRQRPVDLYKVKKHSKRSFLGNGRPKSLVKPAPNPWGQVACRTPPRSPPQAALVSQTWRVSEKLLYDLEILIKGSFEAGRWRFNGNDLIINSSSSSQTLEVQSLHDFLGHLDNGCAAADAQDFTLAGTYWQQAFLKVETLVKTQYHDTIPNIIQKINDLTTRGRVDLAKSLKNHTANCCRELLATNEPTSPIYHAFRALDIAHMPDVEELVMARYHKLFEFYLGQSCYNSFAMMMGAARRRLLRSAWTTFEDCLPSISYLDDTFGPMDRRCLDVIGIRLEVMKKRAMLAEMEVEATLLIQRANMIIEDRWQRFYHLTCGWYFLGYAQYQLRKNAAAFGSLTEALHCEEELCRIDDYHIFTAEKVSISKYLRELSSAGVVEAEESLLLAE